MSIAASAALLGSGLSPVQLVGAAMVLTGATAGVLARGGRDPAPARDAREALPADR